VATAFSSRMRPRNMFAKIVATKVANDLALRVSAAHRESDPFELAKSYLQRRGFHVFSACVAHPEMHGLNLIKVGGEFLSRDEVIAKAERLRS
jgi:hypothetical protein